MSPFVYRCDDGRWAVSVRAQGDEWTAVAAFPTWREAFDHAFRLAVTNRIRYRPWWPPRHSVHIRPALDPAG